MAQIPGTNVAAPLAPFDTQDVYATHDEQYGRGGYRSVNTAMERDQITAERRKPGMVVNVLQDPTESNNGEWVLQLNGTWAKKAGGGAVEVAVNDVVVAPTASRINFYGAGVTSQPDPGGGLRINYNHMVPDAKGFHKQDVLGLEIPNTPGYSTSFPIYTPTDPSHNALINSIQIKQATLGGGQFSYELYAGDPTVNGRLIFDSAATIGISSEHTHTCPLPLTMFANNGPNTIYMKLSQAGSSKMLVNIRTIVTEFSGLIQDLPGYTPPPPYLGPLLSEVYVGPNGDFEEPKYGLEALADGGTMYVEEGMYFLPFGVGRHDAPLDGVRNTAQPNAGKFTHITIKGEGAYKSILNGRGGYGPGPTHPYRLYFGKGMAYSQVPVTYEDLGFIGGGGLDLYSDGEAGLYAEWFENYAEVLVRRCSFDQNENGVFVPTGYTIDPGGPIPSGPGQYVDIRFEQCDFGLRRTNGMDGDGQAHHIYISGRNCTIVDCHAYGNRADETYTGVDAGNCYKGRCLNMVIEGGMIQSGSGRWVDRPWGGQTHIDAALLLQRPGANSNILAYGNEADPTQPPPAGAYDTLVENCDIYISRFESNIWNNTNSTSINFVSNTITFCQHNPAETAPTIVTTGGGAVTGITDKNNPPAPGPYPVAPTAPGSIAQPGYVPVWP